MAHIGEKRPAPEGTPEEEDPKDSEGEPGPTAAKRPAPSFNFRPSPLQQATQGFSLKPSPLSAAVVDTPKEGEASKPSTLQGGFLKLDSNELKPISASPLTLGSTSPSSSAFRGVSQGENSESGGSNQVNHSTPEQPNNLFLQFLARTSSANSFSSVSVNSATSAMSAEATPTTSVVGGGANDPGAGGSWQPAAAEEDRGPGANNGEEFSRSGGGAGATEEGQPFGFQGSSRAILPEITTVTGEEKERNIVQVPARLYAFDVTTHTWKERGRGEARLNDAAQSEGLYQSRLVMRASGSYRVLLNTHLWAQMKCERANQKSIRITAQHGDQGEVSIFLIMGATKDIQQLFTAVDRRIEALRRNQNTDTERDSVSTTKDSAQLPFDDDDKESFLDEPHSSPDSSPDRQIGSRTRLVPTIKTVGVSSGGEGVGEKGREGGVEGEEGGTEEEGEGKREVGFGEGGEGAKSLGKDGRDLEEEEEGEGVGSDRESTTATPPSSRSPSVSASTTTISSSDNAPEPNFSQ